MLKHTFIHIQGIGAVTEQRFWERGIYDWGLAATACDLPLSPSRLVYLEKGIRESEVRLHHGDAACFSRRLPANQSWRLIPDFQNATVYLDIETTGLPEKSVPD